MADYTQGQLFLINYQDPTERLTIQFVPPELTITRNTKIGEVEVIGRNNPLYHYTGGSTKLDFDLEFYAEDDLQEEVIGKCKWIESLGYSQGFQQPPPKVKLVFGNIFRDELWTVANPSYKLGGFDPNNDYAPLFASVKFSLLLDMPKSLNRSDILR